MFEEIGNDGSTFWNFLLLFSFLVFYSSCSLASNFIFSPNITIDRRKRVRERERERERESPVMLDWMQAICSQFLDYFISSTPCWLVYLFARQNNVPFFLILVMCWLFVYVCLSVSVCLCVCFTVELIPNLDSLNKKVFKRQFPQCLAFHSLESLVQYIVFIFCSSPPHYLEHQHYFPLLIETISLLTPKGLS